MTAESQRWAQSDRDFIHSLNARLAAAEKVIEAAEVVMDLWGPVARGQSEFTDALSSLRELLDGYQDQHLGKHDE